MTTRRDFIRSSGLVGAGLALGPRIAPNTLSRWRSGSAPKRLLVLGGTGFIGPNMVRYAAERGHEVTIFTRGRTQAELPDIEHLVGDRNDDLTALEGRTWDVILDNNARDYRWVQRSTELLRDAAEHYVFVSSISAYGGEGAPSGSADRVLREPMLAEDAQRFTQPEGWTDGDEAHYGLTKALSENIVHASFPGRATIVRPGLIVGPGDPTDRFTYWPVRIDEGGEVLAPGNPEHANQVIDQRDLTEWIVRLAEDGTFGNFNAAGPATRMSMAEMLYGIRAATSAPVEFTWVSESFLEAEGLRAWSDVPSWMPGEPSMYVSLERALAAGLTYRPLARTSHDTIEWDKARPAAERADRQAGMTRERERAALTAWHSASGR